MPTTKEEMFLLILVNLWARLWLILISHTLQLWTDLLGLYTVLLINNVWNGWLNSKNSITAKNPTKQKLNNSWTKPWKREELFQDMVMQCFETPIPDSYIWKDSPKSTLKTTTFAIWLPNVSELFLRFLANWARLRTPTLTSMPTVALCFSIMVTMPDNLGLN